MGVIEGCVPVSSPGSMERGHAVIGGGATSTVAESLTPSSSMRSGSGSGSSSSRLRSGSKSSDSLDVDIEIDVHDSAATKPHPIAGSAPSPTAYIYGSGSYGSHGSFGLYMEPTDPVRVEKAMGIHRLMGVRGGWAWAWA